MQGGQANWLRLGLYGRMYCVWFPKASMIMEVQGVLAMRQQLSRSGCGICKGPGRLRETQQPAIMAYLAGRPASQYVHDTHSLETGMGSWWGLVGHRKVRSLDSQGSRCHAGRSALGTIGHTGSLVRACLLFAFCIIA